MTSVRQLRAEAAAELKAAGRACAAADREAKLLAKTRCEFIKVNELRRALALCKKAHEAADDARRAYIRARPVPSKARQHSRVLEAEKKENARRDAIAAVRKELNLPSQVAEYAVRAVERKGRLPRGKERWKALRDKVGGQQVAEAWKRYEREQERLAKKELAAQKRAGNGRRRPRKRTPRKTKPDVQLPEGYEGFVIAQVLEGVEFEGQF